MSHQNNESTNITPIDQSLLNIAIKHLNHRIEKEQNLILKKKIMFLKNILAAMRSSNDSWFSLCPYNYNYRENSAKLNKLLSLIPTLNNTYRSDIIETIDESLLLSLEFYKEYILSSNRLGTKTIDNTNIKIKELYTNEMKELATLEKKEQLTDEEISRLDRLNTVGLYIEYIKNTLPTEIINFYLSGKSYNAFVNFQDNVKIADNKASEIKETLKTSEEETKRIAKILNDQKLSGTFIRLEKAFHTLLRKKRKEEKSLITILTLLGISLFTPPIITLCINSKNNSASDFFTHSIPLITTEIVLIYFFRIALKQYYSTRTQIIQLDFRYSLCEFIGAYAEYSKKLKDNNNQSLLEKFETLIFSNLATDPHNIPSTFDGIKEASEFIQSLKK